MNMNIRNAANFQLAYSFMIVFTGISLIINPNNFFNGFFMRVQANMLNISIMPRDQELSNRHFGIVVCVFSIFYFISGWNDDRNFIKISVFTRIFYGIIFIILMYYKIVPQQWLIAAIWDIITALITLKLIKNDFKRSKLN
jgi:hypothetical protein